LCTSGDDESAGFPDGDQQHTVARGGSRWTDGKSRGAITRGTNLPPFILRRAPSVWPLLKQLLERTHVPPDIVDGQGLGLREGRQGKWGS